MSFKMLNIELFSSTVAEILFQWCKQIVSYDCKNLGAHLVHSAGPVTY